jgi:hypothetical protein
MRGVRYALCLWRYHYLLRSGRRIRTTVYPHRVNRPDTRPHPTNAAPTSRKNLARALPRVAYIGSGVDIFAVMHNDTPSDSRSTDSTESWLRRRELSAMEFLLRRISGGCDAEVRYEGT